ncbi:hypothetical protein BDR07DRAFT_1614709 [Suillus spraguei]|nr:hypothetical protein BDR07DRAFT_1614709 [Suillus spraguei]
MTMVSNDPAWWPVINAYRVFSYFSVFSALTFGQEVELIWRQRWSLITIVYLGVRYLGILYAALNMPNNIVTISLTDIVGIILNAAWNCIGVVAFAMLWVIIVIRLHAMYQRSRKILIFLVATFLAINIFDGVSAILATMHTSGKELILSGTYQCSIGHAEDVLLLYPLTWILAVVWEVLAMCLAAWIAIKHFRELPQHAAGRTIGDCFMVLMKTHVLYFASFVVVSCFQLIINFSPTVFIISIGSIFVRFPICAGLFQFLEIVQMSVLGPRLILGVREYHAKLVAGSDAATAMTSIAFQERVHISTGNGV